MDDRIENGPPAASRTDEPAGRIYLDSPPSPRSENLVILEALMRVVVTEALRCPDAAKHLAAGVVKELQRCYDIRKR